MFIHVLQCKLPIVPTAFSPDGNGDVRNESLCIYGAACIQVLQFRIYDRWGEKVFESTDPNLCWDGTYKGKELNAGVYAYYLSATLNNGTEVKLNGNITLVK